MQARLAIPILIVALAAAPASAQVYARVPVARLAASGELPDIAPFDAAEPSDMRAARPRVVIDGPGEAVVHLPSGFAQPDWHTPDARQATLWLCLPELRDVSGRLYAPETRARSMRRVDFSIPADALEVVSREAWLEIELAHWRQLTDPDVPGSAWFRHRADAAERELGRAVEGGERPLAGDREDELLATFGLFSGQRAVAENLR